MQIFAVDSDPAVAARSLCDQHLGKQILEGAQLLSWTLPEDQRPYKATKGQMNHPLSIAVRESDDLKQWLYAFVVECGKEHQRRFGKIHKSWTVAESIAPDPKPLSAENVFPVLTKAWKCNTAPIDYIQSVVKEKAHDWKALGRPMRWKNTTPPSWMSVAI